VIPARSSRLAMETAPSVLHTHHEDRWLKSVDLLPSDDE
jgi:hypothetical protein